MSIAELKQCIAAGMTARQIRDKYAPDEKVAAVQDAMDALMGRNG